VTNTTPVLGEFLTPGVAFAMAMHLENLESAAYHKNVHMIHTTPLSGEIIYP